MIRPQVFEPRLPGVNQRPTIWRMAGEQPRERRARVRAAAEEFEGVLSREKLRDLGVGRHAVAREVAAGRWSVHGRQTIAVHTGALSQAASWWRAVWEVGCGAVLDGVSGLQACGLRGFESTEIHVSVLHDLSPRAVDGVVIHRVRGAEPERDGVGAGLPRTRAAVAAVRGAQWAVTDRQAALILCMAVQQRLVPADRLCPMRHSGAHYGRTEFVRQVIQDVRDGAQSLGELDFAALCRLRGLPAPSRQVVRQGPHGRIYLDVAWEEQGVVVEVDGAQHQQGLAVMADNLRRNALALRGEIALTIDLVGLRLASELFLDQVEQALRSRSAAGAA